MTDDFITDLRRQLVDAAAGRTRRLPVARPARMRLVLATAAVLAALIVGVVALGVPVNDDEPVGPAAAGATIAYTISGGDPAAAAAVLQARLDAASLAATARAEVDQILVSLADDKPANRSTLDALTHPGKLVMYDWESNLVDPGPMTHDAAIALAAQGAGREIVEHDGDWYVINDNPALTNEDLAAAEPAIDPVFDEPIVALTLAPAGQTAFHELTRDVARRGAELADPDLPPVQNAHHFAIVVDGRLLSLPFIDYEIVPNGIDGKDGAQISGRFTRQTARELAAVLNTGPLPGVLTPR